MSKVKTQYGDLTEKQWKLVVVEKLIAIENLVIDIQKRLPWTDEMKAKAQFESDYHNYLEKKKKQESKKT